MEKFSMYNIEDSKLAAFSDTETDAGNENDLLFSFLFAHHN